MPEMKNKSRISRTSHTMKYMEELRFLCHEIRQPLTAILLLSETVNTGLTSDETNTVYNAGLQSREALSRIQELLYRWEEEEEAQERAEMDIAEAPTHQSFAEI